MQAYLSSMYSFEASSASHVSFGDEAGGILGYRKCVVVQHDHESRDYPSSIRINHLVLSRVLTHRQHTMVPKSVPYTFKKWQRKKKRKESWPTLIDCWSCATCLNNPSASHGGTLSSKPAAFVDIFNTFILPTLFRLILLCSRSSLTCYQSTGRVRRSAERLQNVKGKGREGEGTTSKRSKQPNSSASCQAMFIT